MSDSKDAARVSKPVLPLCSVPYRRALCAGCDVSVYVDPDQPPAVWPRQRHSKVIVFIFGKGADCGLSYKANGRWVEREVQGEQVWIVAAQASFSLRWQSDAPLTMLLVEKRFAHESVGQAIEGATLLSLKVIGTHDVKILQWLENFGQTEKPGGQSGCIYIKAMGTLIAVHLFWILERAITGPATAATSLSLAVFERIERMIEKRMSEKISLWEMAREACMSANNFLRLFKRRIGISPRQYLIQQRLKRAADLLRNPDLSISEIALSVGFSGQSHFDDSFRKLMHCTPTQYRLGYIKGEIPKASGDISED